jgi:hypothetical protein
MPRTRRPLAALTSAAALCLLAAAGCGPSRQSIKGTVVLPAGASLGEGDAVSINFVPEDRANPTGYGAFSAADRSFVVRGASDGVSGLPPGKYKITVSVNVYPGPDSDQRRAAWEAVNESYNTDHSKLNYEAAAGAAQTITIDLVKGTVARN